MATNHRTPPRPRDFTPAPICRVPCVAFRRASDAQRETIADLAQRFGQDRAGIFALEKALLRALRADGGLLRVDGKTLPELPGYQLIVANERNRRATPN